MADEVGARKRVSARGKTSQDTSSKSKQVEKPSTSREDVHKKLTDRTTIESSLIIDGGSYWLTRIVFVRALAFVYCKCTYVDIKIFNFVGDHSLQSWRFW